MKEQGKRLMTIGVVCLVLLLDQTLKIAVKTSRMLGERVQIFGQKWANLYFIENDGMAFGFDFMGTILLTAFRIVAVGLLVYYIHRILRERRLPWAYFVCVGLVLAGAAGNIIDNLFYGAIFTQSTPYTVASLVPFGEGYSGVMCGRVVDMFYFPLIDTWLPYNWPLIGGKHFVFFSPIFNLADAAITCGGLVIIFCFRQSLQYSLTLFSRKKAGENDNK